jgi:diaminopimelate decarboxylase
MYGAAYTVERPGSSSGMGTFTISGKHCETDLLFPNISLPSDIAEGDLLQVLCTAAYNSSMASNYNRYPRPATALIRTDGSFELVQRQEEYSEMFAREQVPADLMNELVKG